jgi:hypothetical protein
MRSMDSRKSAWRGAAGIAALALAVSAFAQVLPVSPGDFPNLKGNNARTGMNGDPQNTGPGQARLTWFAPNSRESLESIILDNTDSSNPLVHFPTQAPFDATVNGSFVAWRNYQPTNANPNPATHWAWPADVEQEAIGPYILPIRRFATQTHTVNNETRRPSYLYTHTTPQSTTQDARYAVDADDLRWFRWQFYGQPGVQENYGVYVWLPFGATTRNGERIFPQRYFVYAITYGNGGQYFDVVDTWAAGGNTWVRLGNGGQQTNRVFPWDGTNPIRVTLYNTVPRDANGNLTMPHPPNNPDAVKQYAVYADAAMAVPSSGRYDATPVAGRLVATDPATNTLFAARNEVTFAATGAATTDMRTVERGVLTAYNYESTLRQWLPRWRFSPSEQDGNVTSQVDNTAAATYGGAFTPDATVRRFAGADALTASVVNTLGSGVTYSPVLNNGTYEIFAYIPGDHDGFLFGREITYIVNAENQQFTYTIDQSQARGWVRIGDRRFRKTTTQQIRVDVTNVSAAPGDATRLAYADAIRFVGEANQAITSTPVYATARIRRTPGGTAQDTRVVLVADESGRIHCLDATGNPDGTTTTYWTYPSVVSPDPNHVAGQDGEGGVAEMPAGFELSTALVQRIGSNDFLFVGTRNGRVYSIEMAGRGDFQPRVAGTTTRRWTYPSTFPATNAVPTSSLGSFRGSISYGLVGGQPTVFVPTTQGRIYALSAGATNIGQKLTSVRWTYPALTEPPLGEIWMTPAHGFNKLFFGTLRKEEEAGRFFALNTETGAVQWELDTNAFVLQKRADHFLSSPAVVPYTTLGFNAAQPGGIVYMLNENRSLYAADSETGLPYFETDELEIGSRASLMYTTMNVYDNAGVLQPGGQTPVIVLPTADGRTSALFARPDMVNRLGTRRAWEYQMRGDRMVASTSVAHGTMFAADNSGILYAFSNVPGFFQPDQIIPGQETVTENNPAGDVFRKSKIRLITREAYRRLRLPIGDPNRLTYQQALLPQYAFTREPMALEWGETAYILVYDFPYRTTNIANRPVPPPVVDVHFRADGGGGQSVRAEARQFNIVGPGDPPNYGDLPGPSAPDGDNPLMDGYAVLQFPFQSGGRQAVPPGEVRMQFTISTQSLNANNALQNVALDPAIDEPGLLGGFSRLQLSIANPLAISMVPNPQARPDAVLGLNADPSALERLVNGSRVVAGVRKDLLATSSGIITHGQSGSSTIYVYDVSMMGLHRPDGMGLDGVRFDRRDLARQGQGATVYKRLNSNLYPGFEDMPISIPNTSVDYPDLGQEAIRITKDPQGAAENPLFNSVQLTAPLVQDGSVLRPMREGDRPEDRVFRPTPVQIDVNVPRYQPPVVFPNSAPIFPDNFLGYVYRDSEGQIPQQGYMARLNVFVDSLGNGNLDIQQREAYRSFNLMSAVGVDERVTVTTPTVDLGSLPTGAGFSSLANPGFGFNPTGGTSSRLLNPWSGNFAGIFREFNVQNEGNVNLVNLRLAKADTTTGAYRPWFMRAQGNDQLTWLEGGWQTSSDNLFSGNIWSDLDWQFSPWPETTTAARAVALQKPRVSDRVPTRLTVNPVRRSNPNIGVGDGALFNTTRFPVRPPRVGVSVPIGHPTGRYGQRMRVIEDTVSPVVNLLPTWSPLGSGIETASDPTFDLLFGVREARLTGTRTTLTDTFIDNLLPSDGATNYAYANTTPTAVRDAFGSLILAWASNRPNWTTGEADEADTGQRTRIYFASLDNGWTYTPSGMTGPAGQNPTSPLRDLNNWNPVNARWFRRGISNYPRDNASILFGVARGETLLTPTLRYYNPAFPQAGMRNPFNNDTVFQAMYFAFNGDVQKTTPTGRSNESRVFVGLVTPSADGSLEVSSPVPLANDPQMAKGKPSILQTPTGAMVFYSGVAGGQNRVFYSRLQGNAFGPSSPLPFGNGFESASAPSVTGRRYTGVNTQQNGNSVIELVFNGKLRGRPNSEVFMGRLRAVDGGGTSGANADRLTEDAQGNLNATNAFVWLPYQSNERLAPEQSGVYRARGIVWNPDAGVALTQFVTGQAPLNLLINGVDTGGNYNPAQDTGNYDPQTGIVSYDTRLGGKVYFDTSLGTVRFSGGTPARNAELRVSYQPRFVRVTPGGTAGYASPTGMYDGRLISELTYWRQPNGADLAPTAPVTNDRFVFTYNRAASGAGQAARPYLSSMRFGVRLPHRILTNEAGVPVSLTVQALQGSHSAYQIDPANGRVYFTAVDEDRPVRITYTGLDEAGNVLTNQQVEAFITLVGERAEEAIPIEQAVNESALSAFLDPFTFANDRRPPLVWLFWTSTRAGNPDLYFQTIAPQWSPVPLGR